VPASANASNGACSRSAKMFDDHDVAREMRISHECDSDFRESRSLGSTSTWPSFRLHLVGYVSCRPALKLSND
jgi:hypothetical protein